jgi:hypothetical protein
MFRIFQGVVKPVRDPEVAHEFLGLNIEPAPGFGGQVLEMKTQLAINRRGPVRGEGHLIENAPGTRRDGGGRR